MKENDYAAIRARFTVWILALIRNTKIDYIRKQKKRPQEVSLYDNGIADALAYNFPFFNNDSFDFENKDLLRAFKRLHRKRKRILILFFEESLTPKEAAAELRCSIQNVYRLYNEALEELKQLMEGHHD